MTDTDQVRAAILEVMTNAALAGHDIGPFDPVDNGYQATYRVCGGTTWLNDKGLRYSLLEDACEGEGRTT